MKLNLSIKSILVLFCGIVPSTAFSQSATVYTSTADRQQSLNRTSVRVESGVVETANDICLDVDRKFQQMDGFGYALTYSACYNLLKMKPEERRRFLVKTFSPTEGYGASYVRMSIGCNDFSSTEYSLCDMKGLKNFALYTDETDYVLPVMKEVLAINPQIKVIAAPWTSPKWMKVDNLKTLTPYDSWTAGHLNPAYRKTYAKYFVKFIKTMAKHGIKIYAVSPQNEPLNPGNCASLFMPWQEQAPFVKELAKEFKKNRLKTKIYLFDHNYNYDNMADQEDYPVNIYKQLGSNFKGSELVVGAAYHNYGGNNKELTDIYVKAPAKELIFSETSIGTWNNGRNLSNRLLDDMREVALGTVNQMCKAVVVWNLMLDMQRGPNLNGGCQTCFGAVDIDESNYSTITLNSHYYIISHLSAVVNPGAYRVATRGTKPSGIYDAAFVNPDGSMAYVVMNEEESQKTINLVGYKGRVTVTLPAKSVVSVKW